MAAFKTTVRRETWQGFFDYYGNPAYSLDWGTVFVLPVWMKQWWQAFGKEGDPDIFSVWHENDLVGIAPLQVDGSAAAFIGNADVCDYLDFVVCPGKTDVFFHGLLDRLTADGIVALSLRCLRPESYAISHLIDILEKRDAAFHREPDGLSLELGLPETWDGYLGGLKSKQRHEVRRKLRRLDEAGEIRFTVYEDPDEIINRKDTFFTLFRESRTDKTEFMTPEMASFFSDMISETAFAGILKMGMLHIDGRPAGVVLYFDYQDRIYLYNNGYDTRFGSVSVGLLTKILLIRHGVHQGRKIFDFLKGPEIYKYRLGGNEVHLSRLEVSLNR